MSAKLIHGVIETCKSMKVIIIAILIVLYTVTGFFLLPFLIERYLPPMLSQRLNSDVSLQDVKINPFKLTLEAVGFQINEPSGRVIAGLQRLYVDFQLSSLFQWALTFADVKVDAPSINIVIDLDGKLNLARLAGQDKTGQDAASPAEEASRPLRILLRNIEINQGRINVTDNRQPIPASVSLFPLNIQMADISTLPEREGTYTLTATSTDGATLQGSGRVSLHPLRSEGNVGFKQIPFTTPWKFVRSQLNIAPPEGIISLETRYLLDFRKETPIFTLDDISVRVMDVGLQIEGEEGAFLNLPEMDVDIGNLDIHQHRIDEGRLVFKGGDLELVMDKDGILNIQRLIKKETETASSSPADSGGGKSPWAINFPEIKLDGLAVNYTDQGKAQAVLYSTDDVSLALRAAITIGSPTAQVQINDLGLTLRNIALGFRDASQPAFQVGNLTVSGGAFDLGARSISISRLELTDGMVDLIRGKDNTINLSRMFASQTPSQKTSDKAHKEKGDPWKFAVEIISLSGFKTRVADLTVNPDNPLIELENIRLTASRFDGKSPFPFEIGLDVVQGGGLSALGKFDPSGAAMESKVTVKDLGLSILQPYLSQKTDLTLNSGLFSMMGTFNRNAKGEMAYQGEVEIADLQIIENSTMDTLLGWEQLKTSDLRLNLNPNGLDIETLKLTGLQGKFIISEDKKVNVVEAFRSKEQPSIEHQPEEPATEEARATFPVRISKLSLDKGILDFADLSLRPQFATKIYELSGAIISISSLPRARTQVELNGRVDEYGSSRITGEINTFDPKQFTDISMVFRNVEMTNLTPYSGKFAGYKIDSGRLSLNLQYKVENSRLLGANKIVIDTLKLGEKVDSPDAVKLPLRLAIALLKDANGVINIDLPVSGNLDDPEFRYGPLIWKALVNLLTKIVTSPFRLLGSLFGGGEDLQDSVSFDPGKGDVPPPEEEKLFKLLEALRQRPQLKLVVTGKYNSDSDGQVIRELQVRRAVAEKSGTVLEPGEDPGLLDLNNPKAQQGLAALFVERYGQEAYDALAAEVTPSDKSADSKQAFADPGALGRLLLSDLVEREQVDPATLKQLADERAQAIRELLTGPDGIAAERIIIRPSESAKSGDQLSSKLDLDAE
jgi:uncharacterized protein involved in outer membrane biogenesis